MASAIIWISFVGFIALCLWAVRSTGRWAKLHRNDRLRKADDAHATTYDAREARDAVFNEISKLGPPPN